MRVESHGFSSGSKDLYMAAMEIHRCNFPVACLPEVAQCEDDVARNPNCLHNGASGGWKVPDPPASLVRL